jgi:hypothetical protein
MKAPSISSRRSRAAIPGSLRGMIGLRPSSSSARKNPAKPFSDWFEMGGWATGSAPPANQRPGTVDQRLERLPLRWLEP